MPGKPCLRAFALAVLYASYGGQNGFLEDVPILIPRTCDYVTLYSKRDFADVIKDFEMGRVFWIIQVGPV